ncbi:peptide ABC transporter substrate-binding protein [Paenibacillus terrigena]|uniref:peptide ABC transporter substrate-binding protein n=1 Tax=Paenibacillus terrigena TaxID=369333 RepID=UPI0003745157|nr:peptide ABC transporter substrate-binding protein [Paenibacillus terrigena]
MKRKSLLLVLTLIVVLGTVLAGCGGKTEKNEASTGTEQKNDSDAAKVSKGGTFRMNLHSEPPSLDPAQAQDNTSGTVLNAIFSGLTEMDKDGNAIPAAAESWKEDGNKITFNLRKDGKWSNGDPVTAHDFEYAWKHVLDPKTTPAPPYAYQMFYLKNGENYNAGKADAASVGVKAVDDYTLEVELENPTPYFISLTSFYTFMPVHKSAQTNPKWAADANTIISNGAFKMAAWQHNGSIELAKNENYFAVDKVNFDKVQMAMIDASATELSMYQTNQLDYTGNPTGELPTDQIPVLKKSLPNEFKVQGIASTYYYVFNNTVEPFDNAKIRKAFAMSIDRQQIVDKVTLGEQIPAFGFVPPGIKGESAQFRDEHKDSELMKPDYAEAKKLLEEGMKEKGYTTLPQITLIHNQSDGHKKIAQAVTDMWKQNLGVTVKVESQEWGVFLKNRTNGNYQIARSGWGADYNDPMTYLDMWVTKGGNNDAKFSNAEYDKLIKDAKTNSDQKVRMEDFAKAEKILIQDNQVILPIYYYTTIGLVKPNLKGMFHDFNGSIHFNNAYFDK